MCFAPIVLIGYLFTLHPNLAHTSSVNDAVIEAQTCPQGPGLDAKVTPSGMGAVSAQYGFRFVESNDWSLTFTPKAGGAILPRPIPELTSTLNFSLGAQLLVGYRAGHLGVEYWHQSNAGLGERNAGLDLIAVMGGFAF